jgi:hypothetical protein
VDFYDSAVGLDQSRPNRDALIWTDLPMGHRRQRDIQRQVLPADPLKKKYRAPAFQVIHPPR